MDASASRFEELPLSAPILRGLADAGFSQPSAIQARAIPLCRFGVDLIAQAKSGTGKTLVFALAALELVQPSLPAPQVLVLAPTREIALQSRDVCRLLGAHVHGLSCHSFVGGTSVRNDKVLAPSCHIACGTPGRVAGLLLEEVIIGERLRLLVLDEADKLCDEGFESQLRYLLTALPERKQTLAFSATYPAPLLATLRASMRAPLMVSLLQQDDDAQDSPRVALSRDRALAASARDLDADDPLGLLEKPLWLGDNATPPPPLAGSPAADDGDGAPVAATTPQTSRTEADGDMVGRAALTNVRQCFQLIYPPSAAEGRKGGASAKQAEVLRLLDSLEFHQAIVFCNQPDHASRLCDALNRGGFPSALISAARSQSERTAAMQRMHAFELRVLVATDLLARGVDFGRVTLVIHHALPHDLPTYLHRVGRTGRFGARGLSVLLLREDELPAATRLLEPLAVTVTPLPHDMPSDAYIEEARERVGGTRRDASIEHDGAKLAELRRQREDAKLRKKATTHRQARPPLARSPPPSAGVSIPRHASAEALEKARARGRERGRAMARQRAMERYGLMVPPPAPPSSMNDTLAISHQLQSEWWEGLT